MNMNNKENRIVLFIFLYIILTCDYNILISYSFMCNYEHFKLNTAISSTKFQTSINYV